jgi:hypothetical protein
MSEVTSLNEHRALAQDDCSLWTPRELLAALIREMDSGKLSADGMVVCYCRKDGTMQMTNMKRAKLTTMEVVGLMEIVKHDLLRSE